MSARKRVPLLDNGDKHAGNRAGAPSCHRRFALYVRVKWFGGSSIRRKNARHGEDRMYCAVYGYPRLHDQSEQHSPEDVVDTLSTILKC